MKILFVCRGNVARSQIAEAFLNHLSNGAHHAISAGVWVCDEDRRTLEGQKICDLEEAKVVLDSMRETGIDVSGKIRKQLTPEMVGSADLVVVMSEDKVPDFLENCDKTIYWSIANPKGKSLDEVNRIRNQILELVKQLLRDLSHEAVT